MDAPTFKHLIAGLMAALLGWIAADALRFLWRETPVLRARLLVRLGRLLATENRSWPAWLLVFAWIGWAVARSP